MWRRLSGSSSRNSLRSPTLAYQTQLNISYEENVFHRLAEIFVESKRYGQAIDEWSQKEFVDRILDLRSKGELQAKEQVTIRCVDQEIVVVTSTQSFVLKRMSIIKEETLEDIMLELDRLTGLNQVKAFIHELLETVNAQKKREQAGQKTRRCRFIWFSPVIRARVKQL